MVRITKGDVRDPRVGNTHGSWCFRPCILSLYAGTCAKSGNPFGRPTSEGVRAGTRPTKEPSGQEF